MESDAPPAAKTDVVERKTGGIMPKIGVFCLKTDAVGSDDASAEAKSVPLEAAISPPGKISAP